MEITALLSIEIVSKFYSVPLDIESLEKNILLRVNRLSMKF
jgi:hypothetical protein